MNLSKNDKIVLFVLLIGLVLAVYLNYNKHQNFDISNYSESSIWRIGTILKDKDQRVSPDGKIKLLVEKENDTISLYRIYPRAINPYLPADRVFKKLKLEYSTDSSTNNGFILNSNSITDISGKQNFDINNFIFSGFDNKKIDNISHILVTNDGISIYDAQNNLLGVMF